MKLLLLGATGLVGRNVLTQALAAGQISRVIAPTRTPLAAHGKLVNPVAPTLNELVTDVMAHAPDAVICALGTTMKKAGSKAAFRHADLELPLLFANAAQRAGVPTFAVVSAMGTSDKAWSFYYKTKAELERDLKAVGFRSLTICRPSLIGGERHEKRSAEQAALAVVRVLAPVLPRSVRVNSAEVIAASLLAAVVTAESGCRYIQASEMI